MRRFVQSFMLISVLLVSRLSFAEEAEAPEADEYAPARAGFQLGLRVSTQIPTGSLGGSTSMSDVFGPRVHVAFDIGSKLDPHFFLGGYVGGSYGLEGEAFGSTCSGTDAYGNPVSCTAESLDGGVVGVVTFVPSGFVDPWIGLTAGYELQVLNYAGIAGLYSGLSPSALGGIDFRIRNSDHKSILSIGPYGGVTIQKYVTGSMGGSSFDASAAPFHSWIHFGVRLTLPS